MEASNLDLHRESVEAVNQRDLDRFLALTDPDVESISRIVEVEGGLHGHEGVRRWWNAWFGSFPDYRLEVVDAKEIGDAVVGCQRAMTHGAESALALEETVWIVTRWREGKCYWWRVCRTEAEALEAAGQQPG